MGYSSNEGQPIRDVVNEKLTVPWRIESVVVEAEGEVEAEAVVADEELRSGIAECSEELRAGMAECSEELRSGMAECSEELRSGMAECSEELREAETLAEKLRTQALTRAGEFSAQLAAQADAIAALRATVDGVTEAAAAAKAQADATAIQLRQELESLKGLVEERHVEGTKYADAARAVMARAMQLSVNAQETEQHRLDADLGRLGSEVEELRGQLELQATHPKERRSKKQKKKTKH